MDFLNLTLTPADKLILEQYKEFTVGLGEYLGDGYEIVLHSLEDVDHSALKVINGFHSGRAEGAPITDLALSMLARINAKGGDGHFTYQSMSKKGDPIKATTIAIKGEGGRIIGLMCINFYLNTSFLSVLRDFVPDNLPPDAFSIRRDPESDYVLEQSAAAPDEIITKYFHLVSDEVYSDDRIPSSLKNKEIIARLNDRNIFSYKDAIMKVAGLLNISKNTVYLHIRNCTGKSSQD